MRVFFELILMISLLIGGSGYVAKKVLVEVRKIALTRIAKGMPFLQEFNSKLTGYKSDF